jgi:hypothetical protein
MWFVQFNLVLIVVQNVPYFNVIKRCKLIWSYFDHHHSEGEDNKEMDVL